MLSYEEKIEIFRSFPELEEKEISENRVNFAYPDSRRQRINLGAELQSSGLGYVNGKDIDPAICANKGYRVNAKGWINIKDFTKDQLKEVIRIAMFTMSGKRSVNGYHEPNCQELLSLIKDSLKEMEENKCVLLTRGDLIQDKEVPLYRMMYQKISELEDMVAGGEELSKVIRHKELNIFMKNESFFMELFDTRSFPKLFDLFEYE